MMSLLDGDDAFAPMTEPLVHATDNQCAEEELEPESPQPEPPQSEPPALSASKVPVQKPPAPSNGKKLLYVCVDIEHTNPTPCLSEIFEIAVAPFATEVVDDNTSVELNDGPYVERIKPSLEFGNNEFNWKTIQLTNCRLKDVEKCPEFPEVMERIERHIERFKENHQCDEVVLCGWNFYSVDHRILVHDYKRHNRDWPECWRWGWDGYRSVFAKKDHRFKITRRTKKNPDGVAAKAGNTSMSVSGIYKAINKKDMENHHQAADDVKATVQILRQNDVWKLRNQGLRQFNGLYLLENRYKDCLQSLTDSREQLYPPLPPGWIQNPDDHEPTDRTKHTVEPGPTSNAAKKKYRLADYFDLHHSLETMKQIAIFTNYYAGKLSINPIMINIITNFVQSCLI